MISLFITTIVAICVSNIYGNESVIVHTKYGDVLGYKTDSARVFYGIPFAQPPVEKLRWNPPVPITNWSPKVINATSRAPACPQPPCNPASPFCPPRFSEDCLYVNVFTPLSVDKPLPVMLFIHGGEFQYLDASTSIYNSERLVNTSNVIVAFVQYRLGALGFLATGPGAKDLKGNYGILDQRLGISWIKSNIDSFGGDPNQITLFGQSAGGQSVALHYVTEDMQGYFQQAIVESAPMAIPFRTYDQYLTPGVLLAEELHCNYQDLDCIRSASVDSIIAAQRLVDTKITSFDALLFFEAWVPVIDHILVHGQLYQTVQNVSFTLKPLIIGTNNDEGQSFIYNKWSQTVSPTVYGEIALAIFKQKALKVLERYPPTGLGDQRPRLSHIATEWVFICPARIFARHTPSYTYVFGYPLIQNVSLNNSFCSDHVCHGDELTFVFQSNWTNFNEIERYISGNMGIYWTNFAKTQNPNQPFNASMIWPNARDANENYLYFQKPLEIRANYSKDDCDFWDQIGY